MPLDAALDVRLAAIAHPFRRARL